MGSGGIFPLISFVFRFFFAVLLFCCFSSFLFVFFLVFLRLSGILLENKGNDGNLLPQWGISLRPCLHRPRAKHFLTVASQLWSCGGLELLVEQQPLPCQRTTATKHVARPQYLHHIFFNDLSPPQLLGVVSPHLPGEILRAALVSFSQF